MPELIPVNACIISAMPEEMAPMHSLLTSNPYTFIPEPVPSPLDLTPSPIGTLTHYHSAEVQAHQTSVLTAVTGIGFAATASTLGWILAHYTPDAIISIGSAGGLSADARVHEVVLGTSYRDGGADGTVFGYVRGQVPGQPEQFEADKALLAAGTVVALDTDTYDIRPGAMLSSDTFVTDANVGDMRETFPSAVTTDMESYAAAHVAHAWAVPFLSIRAISDLCSTPEDQSIQFHAELADVANLSARTALATLRQAGAL